MMRLSLIFGVLFAPKLLVWAQEPTPTPTIAPWTGCTDPAFPDQKITIGEKTLVCLQIGAGVPWNVGIEYIRLSFSPVADQYSRLYIPNCTSLSVVPVYSVTRMSNLSFTCVFVSLR